MIKKYKNMLDPMGHIFDDFPETLKIVSSCPLCRAKFYTSKSYLAQARILDERDNGHLVHIQCKKCKSSVVALIVSSSMGVSSVCLVTDLTSDDVIKFRDRAPVQIDDVLDLHSHLKNNPSIKV